jgi:uncharacterized protein (DUF302 family)
LALHGVLQMTFDEAVGQLQIAVRQHGAALEDLLVRLRAGALSKERFVAELAALHKGFEETVEDLTREAKSSALATLASLKASKSNARN